MDSKELMAKLKDFQAACSAAGRPLSNICLEEAYPGDDSTSYILEVTAPWMDNMACFPILDFLNEKLFATTDIATRKRIFFIRVLDKDERVHCYEKIALVESQMAST